MCEGARMMDEVGKTRGKYVSQKGEDSKVTFTFSPGDENAGPSPPESFDRKKTMQEIRRCVNPGEFLFMGMSRLPGRRVRLRQVGKHLLASCRFISRVWVCRVPPYTYT